MQVPSDHSDSDDIVFECPNCGKSIAVEREGEGLVIDCPGCACKIQIPHPAGGFTPGKNEHTPGQECAPEVGPDQIRKLLEALESSQSRIQELTVNYQEAQRRRAFLERMRAEHLGLFREMQGHLEAIRQHAEQVAALLEDAD